MVGVYKDIDAEDEFAQYFSEDGIVPQKQIGLHDL